MLGDSVYGAYLDKEQALLDAVDAARDALQSGRKARVWLKDRSNAAHVFEVEPSRTGRIYPGGEVPRRASFAVVLERPTYGGKG